MAVWVYESHLGGLFTIPSKLSVDECYCEQCGDYDWEIGCFETMADFVAAYADNIATNQYEGGIDIDALIECVGWAFEDKLTHGQVKEIAMMNKTYEEEDDE